MTATTKEESKFLSLLSHLIESCSKSNYKDLAFLSNEQTFKSLLIEIEPKLEETGGIIELTKDESFGVRYGNFVSILKVLEAYLLKHSNRDTFTTVNLQSMVVINDILQNNIQQLMVFAEILLFLAAISSKKDFYIDKAGELEDEAIVSFFFASIEKYIFIESDAHNNTMSKSLLDKSANAHKYYEKEKKNYINIIKDYEIRFRKMKETIEALEKAKQVLETKLNDQIRENQMMNRNQNKTDAIHEQLITNTLTNNDLMNKLTFKDLEIEELKKELELNNKHSLAQVAKLEEQIEIQNEKLKEGKEIRNQFERLQSKYKDIKLSKDSKNITNEEIFKALEQRNIQIEMQQKEKAALMNQIEKLNKEILNEKELRKTVEFEKKQMEFEISDLKNDIKNNANFPYHKKDSSFSINNKDQMDLGISMEGILNDTSDQKQLFENMKMIQTPSNTMQILALNDEVLKLKEENSQLLLKLEEAKGKNKQLSSNKEKMDVQLQKYQLEIQKQTMMIDRIRNEAKRFEDDNKCLNEKIKEMTKKKKNDLDAIKKDNTSKTALIETMLSEKKGMVNEFQKLQKEYENYKQSVAQSSQSGNNDKKALKASTGLQQQQQSNQAVVVSNSEILSLRNEIQNLKLAMIQKDNQIQTLKDHQANELTEEEINTKLADLDFYKKSYEEQKTRVNREHELISDSLHKLAIHFMGLKDNLQKKMTKNK